MEYINKKLNEFNDYIRFRKVAIVGLGVSNLPLMEYLYEKKANVTVFDERDIDSISKDIMDKITTYGFGFHFGEDALKNLKGFNVIFRSPSCLPTRKELVDEANNGAIVTTEVELLMKMCPCKIVGVTGSDGKTTTTSLINAILKKAGYNTFLGGNIGTPLFTKLSDMKPEDILVLELSSFQLMGMEISPDIAVITNITPNHLNIHKDYEEYIEAKKNIFKYQDEKGVLVLNYDNEITRNCEKEANGKVIFFSSKNKLDNGYIVDEDVIKECEDKIRKHILNVEDVILRGNHNYQNIATAIAATSSLVDMDIAVDAIKEFKPVEHRIEFIRELDGVKWYNDSASSSPSRTLSGINAFKEDIILIAGGYDKNLDYTPLAKPIIKKVKSLILIGQTSGKIFDVVKLELERENKELDIHMCETLEETVNLAKKVVKPGQVVLFSPASASFDMFKNFADRGNQFKELVKKIN
ncbi:MAG: UDP-N-acetylmuramoyl-L-alanine--D-glutamate ligase [Clostridia bacterium]